MKVIRQTDLISREISKLKTKNKNIGFVPTMGALHEGHMSLLKKASRQNHRVIVSVFVNPTQFNDPQDLQDYPRTFETDRKLLEENDCDIMFFPSVTEIYPSKEKCKFQIDLSPLDELMEGKFRPGHFEGVAQVVKRLLDIVNPDRLYMGQKDFQQHTIIQYMIDKLKIPTQLVVCKTKREKDGLAMSSRNRLLDKALRAKASIIYKTLKAARRKIKTFSPAEIEAYALKRMSIPGFKAEYFNIVDGYDLSRVQKAEQHEYIVACTAVWAGEVRLIDNLILKKNN